MQMHLLANGVVSMLLLISALCGDKLVQLSQHSRFLQALSDNVTHAVVAGFTWIGIVLNERRYNSIPSGRHITEILLCSFISSGIDVDHFIAAHSLQLKDAVSLSRRPFLHCTTVPLVVCSVLLSIGYLLKEHFIGRLSWIIVAAFLSHHIRDAARHGLWLWPFGSTPPFGTSFYLLLTVILPPCLRFMMFHISYSFNQTSSVSIV